MRPSKAHFVTSCQQLLALGAVLAVLTPAASVISLDVVRQVPAPATGSSAGNGHAVALTAYTREARRPAPVPTAPVSAEVTDHQLTPEPGSALGRRTVAARTVTGRRPGVTAVVSRPQPVAGYGGVGITWDPASRVSEEELGFEVRTRTSGSWSDWTPLEYHAEHGPDPEGPEARKARPGTDVLFVGEVDDVQVRATVEESVPPADMTLSVVSPGEETTTSPQLPAIETAPSARTTSLQGTTSQRLASYTPRPRIFSRAQWGADERLRDKGSLRYFEVHAGFVHHTVNANGYTRREVPGILRSIYAYHTQSRGWSDVGYNFLVDRFGRIWEGRYGGVDRPVVGAHTLGYNDHAFAMSAIGNFDVARPSSAMVQAYGTLFAWKLSLHGVDASSSRQWVGSKWFPAVNGHRDAGSTACPGRYLYARLGRIRDLATAAQQDWSGRELQSDLTGDQYPDLVVRRAGDKRLFVIPTGGLSGFRRPVVSEGLAEGSDAVVVSPDLTGDGVADLVVRRTNGVTRVHPGDGDGGFGAGVRRTRALEGRELVTAVGDLDGDGHNDLVARTPSGRANAFLGSGTGSFDRVRMRGSLSGYRSLAATGDLDGDGDADLLARDASGRLWALPGTGRTALGTPVQVAGSWDSWATVTGFGDFNRDGRADLFVRGSGRSSGWIVPAVGDFEFGRPLGPIARFKRAGVVAGAAQLMADRLPDVVSIRGGDVRSYANTGRVELAPRIATGIRLRSATALLNVGDWDRDGFGDIIHRTRRGALVLRPGEGTGRFGDPVRLAGGFGDVRLLAAVGDMTGDGYPDLMGQPGGGSMRIYPGNGRSGLASSYVAHTSIDAGAQVPIGRWDKDGAPDSLFRSGRSMVVYPGNGPGGLTGRRSVDVDLRGFDWVLGVSDIRGRGHSDVIVRHRATGRLYVWKTTAANGFQGRRYLGEGLDAYDLAG